MKLKLPKEPWKNCGPPPLISYKSEPTFVDTPTDKSDFLKVDMKNQPGKRGSKTVAIYVTLFWTGSIEALPKFVTLLYKVIWGQDLSTGPQKFGMTRNFVIREALRVLEQKIRER